MSKGEQTYQMIVERAARVFNRQGYSGTSLSDLMAASGLEKGGIYNHFRSKEDLAVAAFEYSIDLAWQRIRQEYRDKRHAADRLEAMLVGYQAFINDPIIPGGCPLLNTAVESDDTQPRLRQHARDALTRWREWIMHTVARGIAAGEVRAEVDGDVLATHIISTLEGAIMMTKLYDDPTHIQRAVTHLTRAIEETVRA
jgi:AcrR family transcriptional regulator